MKAGITYVLGLIFFAGCAAAGPSSGELRDQRLTEPQMMVEVQKYLANGGHIDGPVETGFPVPWVGVVYRTHLKIAAERGYAGVVSYLLRKGANPNFTGNSSGAFTAVHWASTPDVLNLLLKAGGDIRYSEKAHWGRQPIHFAALMGWPSAVQWYIDHGVSPAVTTTEGETPLHFARDQAVAEVLLKAGADVNARTIDTTRRFTVRGLPGGSGSSTPKYATPLHYAARARRTSLVKYLLNSGADPDIRDSEGRLPVDFAAESGSLEAFKVLWPASRETDAAFALRLAAGSGETEVCRHLLALKADPNVAGKNGWTALHKAAFDGHAEVVRLLLAAGAKTDVTVNDGETPLILASRAYGNVETIRALLDAGASVEAKTEAGRSALHEAASAGKAGVVELLLARGADPAAVDSGGNTAIDLARKAEKPDVVRVLEQIVKD